MRHDEATSLHIAAAMAVRWFVASSQAASLATYEVCRAHMQRKQVFLGPLLMRTGNWGAVTTQEVQLLGGHSQSKRSEEQMLVSAVL